MNFRMNSTSRNKPYHRYNERAGQRTFQVKNEPWQKTRDVDDDSVPEIVGYFSVDENRVYLPNSSLLSYYNPPESENICFDLNHGIERVHRKPSSADEEKIDHLLKWITLNDTKIKAPIDTNKRIRPDFVCFRGLLTILLCTPFSPRDPWIICAAKWNGTIYLCAFKTPDEKRRIANLSKDDLRFMSWGFKFEQYILSEHLYVKDSPDETPDTSKPVDEAAEFCCMFQRRFGNHMVLYGAEMDGVMSKTRLEDPLPLKDLKFVELKTSREIEHDRQERNFRKFKLLKWWSQSYLVGIDKICCGFRDDSGIVKHLTYFGLPEIIEKSKSHWNPKSCMHYCSAFLTRVSQTVVNDCDKTIYKFEKIPYEDIVTTEESPTSEYAFMKSSYMQRT